MQEFIGHNTDAQLFSDLIVPLVYEGDKTESQVAQFIAPNVTMGEWEIPGLGVTLHTATFPDKSVAIFVRERNVICIGELRDHGDGKLTIDV